MEAIMRHIIGIATLLAVGAAHAGTGKLWHNAHTGDRLSFESPAAACGYIGTVLGRVIGKDRGKCWKEGENGFKGFEMSEYYATEKTCKTEYIKNNGESDGIQIPKNLDTLHWMRPPIKGKDAGKWYPDKFKACENNCTVSYAVYDLKKGSVIYEADGTSRKAFTKFATGDVCASPPPDKKEPEPPKPDTDDDSKPDDNKPDNGGGDQGGGSGDSGGNSGDGGGAGDSDGIGDGGNGGGKDSDGDGKGGDDSGGGKDDGGGKGDTGSAENDATPPPIDVYIRCPSGRGSYKRGTVPTGDCAKPPPEKPKPEKPKEPDQPKDPAQPPQPQPPQPPAQPDKPKRPGGGGIIGGGGGGNNNDGKPDNKPPDGGDNDGKPDNKPPGGGGNSGGGKNDGGGGNNAKPPEKPKPGGDTGGGGNGNGGKGKDDNNGSPNGKDDGKGDGDKDGKGDGKGSISGGDCKSGRAPICKGDPVQCYIAREQWRTACLAERGGGTVKGGSCKDNKPPECKGDATQCYIVKQQFYQGCQAARAQSERDAEQDYVGDNAGTIGEIAGSSMGDAESGLKGNGKSIDLGNILDLGGYGWSRTCPALPSADMGKWGKFEMDGAPFCTIAQLIGNILVAITLLFSVRYVFS